jgi:hypothetical protein
VRAVPCAAAAAAGNTLLACTTSPHKHCTTGGLAYDVLLWRNLKWPALAMAWLPASAWEQPPGVAAQQRAAVERRQDAHTVAVAAAAAASAGSQQQQRLAAMPVEHHHLLLGEQTSGADGAHLVLYRAEVAGQLQQQQPQTVVMQEGELLQVMVRHWGRWHQQHPAPPSAHPHRAACTLPSHLTHRSASRTARVTSTGWR